eukprot:14511159-Alexandrium_andersonii.AAC.1
MSASLVGSEMCIRDRLLFTARGGAVRPSATPIQRPPIAGEALSSLKRLIQGRDRPVPPPELVE